MTESMEYIIDTSTGFENVNQIWEQYADEDADYKGNQRFFVFFKF